MGKMTLLELQRSAGVACRRKCLTTPVKIPSGHLSWSKRGRQPLKRIETEKNGGFFQNPVEVCSHVASKNFPR